MFDSRIALNSDKFLLGRASSCDYSIKVSDMGGLKWLQAVSKVQCEILKTDKGPFIKDHSSNGKDEISILTFASLLLQGPGWMATKLERTMSGLWNTTPRSASLIPPRRCSCS